MNTALGYSPAGHSPAGCSPAGYGPADAKLVPKEFVMAKDFVSFV